MHLAIVVPIPPPQDTLGQRVGIVMAVRSPGCGALVILITMSVVFPTYCLHPGLFNTGKIGLAHCHMPTCVGKHGYATLIRH